MLRTSWEHRKYWEHIGNIENVIEQHWKIRENMGNILGTYSERRIGKTWENIGNIFGKKNIGKHGNILGKYLEHIGEKNRNKPRRHWRFIYLAAKILPPAMFVYNGGIFFHFELDCLSILSD